MNPTSTASKTSQNGSGVPQWMKDAADIKPGEWYSTSKFRTKHLIEVTLTAEEQRVNAIVELGTMAYHREDAVCTVKGNKLVRMTPRFIKEQSGLTKQNVRRAIEGLETKGILQRLPIDPSRGLTKGNVEIKSWLKPRPPAPANEENGSNRATTILRSLPELAPLLSFAKRFKIELDPELLSAARDSFPEFLGGVAKVQAAEKELIALLGRVSAKPRLYKDERNGKELERNPPPPQPFVNGSNGRVETVVEEEEEKPSQLTETPKPTPRAPDLYQEFKQAYPKDRFDEAKAKPLFRALPRPVQQAAVNVLRDRYLTCERWLDEGGKWIPFASKWLNEKQYDADPPPKWSKQQNRGKKELAPIDDVLALMRRNREAT